MGVTEIGALIVALRSESAQFRAEMERGRTSVRSVGQQADATSRQMAKLAADGFGAVLPISFQVENALERFIEKAGKAQGAMALLGKATIAIGVGLGAFKLGERIGEFAALGTTAEKYAENLKKATDEQLALSRAMEQQRNIARGLALDLAKVRGDEDEALRLSQSQREADLLKQLGGARGPAALEQLANQRKLFTAETAKLLSDRRRLRDEADALLLEQITRERDEQVKKWREETAALAEQLKIRLKLRQDFEAQLGLGGFGGGAASGFAAARTLREQIQKEARDLAFLEREGLISQTDSTFERERIRSRAIEEAQRLRVEFGALPAVLDAIDRALGSVEFGNFGLEIAAARAHLAAFVPTSQELQTALGGIASKLIETLPATDAAAEATRALSAEYQNLAFQVYQSRIQLAALAGEQAASGVPQ